MCEVNTQFRMAFGHGAHPFYWVTGPFYDADPDFKILDKELYKIKVLTSELTFLRPIDVQFDIFAGTKEQYKDVLRGFAENNTYIEITTATNLVYASDTIKQMAYDKIIDFFSEGKFALGSEVNFSGLAQDIFNIPGVENVRTVMKDDDQSIYRIQNGLCFASWSDTVMLDVGDDLEIGNASRKLEDF